MNEHRPNNSQRSRVQPSVDFKSRFGKVVGRLRLCEWLSDGDLGLLCVASFYASLCNVAFNGLGGCAGEIKPERELNRIALEQEFMCARTQFWSQNGAKAMPAMLGDVICQALLKVRIADENLAGGAYLV